MNEFAYAHLFDDSSRVLLLLSLSSTVPRDIVHEGLNKNESEKCIYNIFVRSYLFVTEKKKKKSWCKDIIVGRCPN